MRAGRAAPKIRNAVVAALLFPLVMLSPVLLHWGGPRPLELLALALAVLGVDLVLRWRGAAGSRARGSILVVGVSLAIVVRLSLLFAGPPHADRSLVPEVVGVIVRWDYVEGECQMTRLTLESGQTLDLRLLGDSRAKCGDGPWETGVPELTRSHASLGTSRPGEAFPNGGVLYYGHDGQADWIAGAWTNELAADAVACPYTLSGSGYDEGNILHLSTGLVVKKTADFENKTLWMTETSTFSDSDTICVNRRGEAVSISRFIAI